MRFLIMAAGAVGGYFGGLLARAGEDVLFVARGDTLRAIRERGLRVESVTSGDFTARARATDAPDGAWTADFALFCVKGYDNAAAVETMRPAIGADTTILTLQNGLGSGGDLAAAFGRDRVMLGAAYVDASQTAPGVYRELGGVCRILLGEPDGGASPRGEALAARLGEAGIEAAVADDMRKTLWEKLIYICALSGMTCVTRSSFAEVMDTPETAALAAAVVAEAAAVGRAAGVNLDADAEKRTMDILRADKDSLLSSMSADLNAGKPLEVGNLNGRVSRLGREYGAPTPINDMITACLTPAHNRAMARRASR